MRLWTQFLWTLNGIVLEINGMPPLQVNMIWNLENSIKNWWNFFGFYSSQFDSIITWMYYRLVPTIHRDIWENFQNYFQNDWLCCSYVCLKRKNIYRMGVTSIANFSIDRNATTSSAEQWPNLMGWLNQLHRWSCGLNFVRFHYNSAGCKESCSLFSRSCDYFLALHLFWNCL